MQTTLRWQRIQDPNSYKLRERSWERRVMKTKPEAISKKAIVPRVNIESNRQVVEQVSWFTYLGKTITENGKCDEAKD